MLTEKTMLLRKICVKKLNSFHLQIEQEHHEIVRERKEIKAALKNIQISKKILLKRKPLNIQRVFVF